VELVRARNIRWLIVKRELQIKADVTPQREATMKALLADFNPYTRLAAYDVYRRP
jgi:Fe2+ or Zn2+ uptake regulation protein